MQPDELTLDKTGIMEEPVAMVLDITHPREKNPPCSTLEVYEKITFFVPLDITADVVELVA